MRPLYKARAGGTSRSRCLCRWVDLGKIEELPAFRKRAVHERPPARLFSRLASGLEGRDPQGIEDHAADAAGRERQSSRSRRPRLIGDRPRHRAARPRPPAQADLQDRCRAAANRGQHLRLLRGDRRADLAEAARSPPDRNAVGRGAGAPREARKGLPRRVALTTVYAPHGEERGTRVSNHEAASLHPSRRLLAQAPPATTAMPLRGDEGLRAAAGPVAST
jgi:hypothetical protein